MAPPGVYENQSGCCEISRSGVNALTEYPFNDYSLAKHLARAASSDRHKLRRPLVALRPSSKILDATSRQSDSCPFQWIAVQVSDRPHGSTKGQLFKIRSNSVTQILRLPSRPTKKIEVVEVVA